jgi:hypothetical protein
MQTLVSIGPDEMIVVETAITTGIPYGDHVSGGKGVAARAPWL